VRFSLPPPPPPPTTMASSKYVVKLSTMSPDMQEFAIQCATDAIAAKNTEQVGEGSNGAPFISTVLFKGCHEKGGLLCARGLCCCREEL